LSIELITILMFASLLTLIAAGVPIFVCLGAVGAVFAYFIWGPDCIGIVAASVWVSMKNFLMIAVPLFIFMAYVLETSGIADDLYRMMHRWFGTLRGGLAIGTVVICTMFAAMSGLSATGTVTMGLVALPAMLKRGYNKEMAVGSVMGGGALGILIPPSIPLIIYSLFSASSIGRLFLGGMLPGLLLSGMFIAYIVIRCLLKPSAGPALPPEERAGWRPKFISLRAVILPVLLIIGVLGSIFAGIASPTEAAAVGAFGAIISAAVYRRLSWEQMKKATFRTLGTTAMVLWIYAGACCFTAVYNGTGAVQFITHTIEALRVSPWFILIGIQVSLFILGMFLDPIGIMMITLPVYLPVVSALGFDLVWFGILFTINMEMAYLTPPFGFNLFYMKGIAPEGITMPTVYRAAIPFVALQAIGLAIVMIFPQIALYLPNLLMGMGG